MPNLKKRKTVNFLTVLDLIGSLQPSKSLKTWKTLENISDELTHSSQKFMNAVIKTMIHVKLTSTSTHNVTIMTFSC